MDRRIYFSEGQPGSFRIAQVSVTGGAVARVETPFANAYVTGLKPDGSALLAFVSSSYQSGTGRLWSLPLPAGQPRRLGSFEIENADIFPDGRILFDHPMREPQLKEQTCAASWFGTTWGRILPEVHVVDAVGASIEEQLAVLSFDAPPHERDLPPAFAVNSDAKAASSPSRSGCHHRESKQQVVIIDKLDDHHFWSSEKATFWETLPFLRSASKHWNWQSE